MRQISRYEEDFYTKPNHKFFEMNSLLSGIITPIVAFIWLWLHPEVPEHLKWAFKLFSLYFILMFCLIYISNFFRRNLEHFLQVAYFLVSTFVVYLAYYYDYSQSYSILFLVVVFYIALTFNKMSTLLYYLLTIKVLLGISIFLKSRSTNMFDISGMIIFLCILVFSVIAIYNLYIRNRDQRALNEIAFYDSVTRLPNRHFLNKYLSSSLDSKPIVLLFIDLDKFKFINDTLGHNVGDAVLQQVSKELKKCLLENDFVARYGGDEFIAILENADQERAEQTVQQIVKRFSNPMRVEGQSIDISASIGISCYPVESGTAESLIKHADVAMYHAKSSGRNNYTFYTPDMSKAISRRLQLENGLLRALKNGEFIVQYQPKIHLETGEISGAEALLRWNHPELGLVPPNEFIPIAEETGLIIPIGEWVLKTSCMQSKIWQKSGLLPINLALNVSYQQLKTRNFILSIQQALAESGLDPQFLELEITESMLREAGELKIVLDALRPIGIKLAIDDFGVGYSSLSMLQYVDINNLKIDMSLIKDIPESTKAEAIAKTIIELGKNLNCTITAEGVETKEQFDFLKKNNCHFGQGYLFSRPLDGSDFEKLLRNWRKD
ncbi:putative bifunctional diguanylate cyclase/phosphodiesterase [Paenibacillus aestuarii]|uniref:Bifunctional diguanylate cyclase/phosphodiesterase n=1 Tax=Paenibacillus aestuarii TaxID=516965 RepID=A0ABW0KAF0_9BACL|nr:EAL domain-containing protein [Paenibacillus aestuarii]